MRLVSKKLIDILVSHVASFLGYLFPMRDLAKKNCNYDELVEENQFLLRENDCLRKDVAYLEDLVRHLKRQKFDRSSEVYSPGQRTLFNESELESSLDNESVSG